MKKITSGKKIITALQILYDNFDCRIQNPTYRGSYDIIPFFTFKQIQKVASLSISTIRKWCDRLQDEGLIIMRGKRQYFANSSFTHEVSRRDFKSLRLYKE